MIVQRVLTNPKVRVPVGWVLFLGGMILWPISLLTFGKSEPVTVLCLSWIAIVLEGWNALQIAEDAK